MMINTHFNSLKLISTIGLVGLLSACSAEQGDSSAEATAVNVKVDSEQQADKPTGVIPAHQLKALESAKSVEGVLKDADARRRAQDQ